MNDKTNKYYLTFEYDRIPVATECRDYWWDDNGKILVIVSGVTSFYEKSRISHFTERRLGREEK
jgi:hypothetical protein